MLTQVDRFHYKKPSLDLNGIIFLAVGDNAHRQRDVYSNFINIEICQSGSVIWSIGVGCECIHTHAYVSVCTVLVLSFAKKKKNTKLQREKKTD